ncbi:unnamed protein product [Owenia fusiformis]|uniref:WAP domain-containing protein n=1 Tax=Owenia fusiformis TaxID=6347 RepID=A0A8S4PPS8_OWEFU|nr:unnamed protein product [Owenia fusiformis]
MANIVNKMMKYILLFLFLGLGVLSVRRAGNRCCFEIDGETKCYQVGKLFLSPWDCCNKCTCDSSGLYSCTEMACVGPKPGKCPQVNGNRDKFGICIHECNDDRDCAGCKKCCSNGCGNQCVDPL